MNIQYSMNVSAEGWDLDLCNIVRSWAADLSRENVGTCKVRQLQLCDNGVCSRSCQTGKHVTGRWLLWRQRPFGFGPK